MTIASFIDEGMQPLVIDIITMGRVNMISMVSSL